MAIDPQILIACIAVSVFAGAAIGYIARDLERAPAPPHWQDVHHSRESVEQRSRRVQ